MKFITSNKYLHTHLAWQPETTIHGPKLNETTVLIMCIQISFRKKNQSNDRKCADGMGESRWISNLYDSRKNKSAINSF